MSLGKVTDIEKRIAAAQAAIDKKTGVAAGSNSGFSIKNPIPVWMRPGRAPAAAAANKRIAAVVGAPAASAKSGYFSSLLSSLPSFTRKSARANPFAGMKGAKPYDSFSKGNALTLSSDDPITPLTTAEKAEIASQEALARVSPNRSSLNKYRSMVPAPLFLNPSSVSSSLQGARDYMTTLKEGTNWKKVTQNTGGKNVITSIDPLHEKAEWSKNAAGRAGSKFYQNVVFDTYPDASIYGQAANFKRANGTVVDPTAFITERKGSSKIRVYGKTPADLDLVVREGSRRIIKQQLNTYTKKLGERSDTDKKKWDGIVKQRQDMKNQTLKKVSKMYGDYLKSISEALNKQLKIDNEQIEIQTNAFINDEIPEFARDSVYIPKPLEIKGASGNANAMAKGEAAKAVTVDTIKTGMEAAAKGAPAPAVPLNAVAAPAVAAPAAAPKTQSGLFGFLGFGSTAAAAAPVARLEPSPSEPAISRNDYRNLVASGKGKVPALTALNPVLTVGPPLPGLPSPPPPPPPPPPALNPISAPSGPQPPSGPPSPSETPPPPPPLSAADQAARNANAAAAAKRNANAAAAAQRNANAAAAAQRNANAAAAAQRNANAAAAAQRNAAAAPPIAAAAPPVPPPAVEPLVAKRPNVRLEPAPPPPPPGVSGPAPKQGGGRRRTNMRNRRSHRHTNRSRR
jgi:hypothetical protein